MVFPGPKKICGVYRESPAKEYWIFCLIHGLIIFGLQYPHFFGTIDPHARLGQIEMLYLFFGTLIPLVAVSVRRLHDINRSGWWSLSAFISLLNLGRFFRNADSRQPARREPLWP